MDNRKNNCLNMGISKHPHNAPRFYPVVTEQHLRNHIKLSLVQKYVDELLAEGITPFNTKTTEATVHELSILGWLDKFRDYKLSARISDSSKNNYRWLCGKFREFIIAHQLSRLPPDEFTAAHLNLYIDYIQQKKEYENRTIRHYYGMVRTFLNWLYARDIIPQNPAYKLKERLMEFKCNESNYYLPPPDEDINKVVINLRKNLPMLLLFQQFIYYCSLRRKEVFSLRIADIDMEEQRINMSAMNTKNAQTKFPQIPDIFARQIPKDLLRLPKEWFIFGEISCGNKEVIIAPAARQNGDPNTITKIWNKIVIKGLGIKMRLYSNKHLGISRAIDAGIPQQAMQKHADHRSPGITMRHYYKKRNSFNEAIKSNYPSL